MLIGTDQLGNPYSIVIDSATGALLVTPAPGITPSTGDNSISQTAFSLITSAMRLIGVLASGEQPDVNEANDALMVFNQMIDAWNAESLAIYTTSASDYPLTIGKQSYTLGPGGDFNTNRPAQIDAMSAILLYSPSVPVEVPITMYSVEDWQIKVPVKNVTGSFPLYCYDDGNFPLRTLYMWPIPASVCNVRIYAWQPLGTAAALTSTISYPPGYAQAFRYNLAVLLAAEFGTQVSATIATVAVESFARIKTMNAPDLTLRSDIVKPADGYRYKADLFGIGF